MSDSPFTPSPRPPDRRVYDPVTKREWTVRAAKMPVAGGGTTRCLIFSDRSIARRVCDVPTDWRALSDAELVALMYQPGGEPAA